MKKIWLILPITFICALSGCITFPNHRNNYFIEGRFCGTCYKDETLKCSLLVTEIDEDTYYAYNGIDVVEDLVKPSFYKLSFSTFTKDGLQKDYHFSNLHSVYDTPVNAPVQYEDDSNYFIDPYFYNNFYKNYNSTIYYIMIDEYLEFYLSETCNF